MAALLIAALPASAGCTNEFQILAAEAPQLSRGVVHTDDGSEEHLRKAYTVELVPHSGAALLRPDRTGPALVAVPLYDTTRPPQSLFARAPWLDGPVDVKLGGGHLLFIGANDTVDVPESSLAAVRIKQLSPGKTAGLVIGSTAGAVALGLIIGLGVLLANSGY